MRKINMIYLFFIVFIPFGSLQAQASQCNVSEDVNMLLTQAQIAFQAGNNATAQALISGIQALIQPCLGNEPTLIQASTILAEISTSTDNRTTNALLNSVIALLNPEGSNTQGTGDQIAFISDRNGNSELYVMDADGGNVRQVTHNDSLSIETDPSWSPDGTQLLYSGIISSHMSWEIYTVNHDGSNLQPITNDEIYDFAPVWSPLGHEFAFISSRDQTSPDNSDIYIMNIDGSNVRRMTTHSTRDMSPVWSPDGTSLLLVSERDGNFEIYSINLTGTDFRRLTTNTASDHSPEWSPNGEQIVFESNRDGNYEIYVMDADGSHQTRLTTTTTDNRNPTWSSDGSIITFERVIDGQTDIFNMNSDGSNAVNLTNNDANDSQPSRSHISLRSSVSPVLPTVVPTAMPTTTPIPLTCTNPNDTVTITLTIDLLHVIDPEEADTTSIFGGDEIEFYYGLAIADGNSFDYGRNNGFIDSYEANLYQGDRIRNFRDLEREVSCSDEAYAVLYLTEDDGMMGGIIDLGVQQIEIPLDPTLISLYPMEDTFNIEGRTHDGSYNYAITIIVDVN